MATAVDYRRKIYKLPELVDQLGRVREGKTVVLCHGTFDIVHPGHLRHLRFAKEKGNILVVSLTCDEQVQKGKDRPYITQDLRAENLAALELVDYVYIDKESTPIAALSALKPDIFIKGYEYDGQRPDAHPKTQEEMRAVTAYGGKMIFSPGDIVFSSTTIIRTTKPKVTLEKISAMCRTQGIGRAEILGTLAKLATAKILLVGDTIIDQYHHCTVLGSSTKTPTFSIKKDASETFIGGAAVVAQNMANFGADVRFVTLVGADADGEYVTEYLKKQQVNANLIVDSTRPTTKKEIFESGGYKLIQIDQVDNTPLLGDPLIRVQQIMEQQLPEVHTVVFSDFRHGLFHHESIPTFLQLAKDGGKKIVADTQVASRWGNILDYKGADLLCATEREVRFAVGDQDCGLTSLGRRCLTDAGAQALIMKLGEKGLIAFEYPHGANKEFYPIEALARDAVDTKGAGDALLSAAALALSVGAPLLTVAFLSSCAAAVRVERMGNAPLSFDDMRQRVTELVETMGLD